MTNDKHVSEEVMAAALKQADIMKNPQYIKLLNEVVTLRWKYGEQVEEVARLRHDLERQMSIANEYVNEVERQRAERDAVPPMVPTKEMLIAGGKLSQMWSGEGREDHPLNKLNAQAIWLAMYYEGIK